MRIICQRVAKNLLGRLYVAYFYIRPKFFKPFAFRLVLTDKENLIGLIQPTCGFDCKVMNERKRLPSKVTAESVNEVEDVWDTQDLILWIKSQLVTKLLSQRDPKGCGAKRF